MKNQKGITLIALVITIIVLLILAGVSISMVIGNNGILNQASTAAIATKTASEQEQIELAYLAAKMESYSNGGQIKVDTIKNQLSSAGINAEVTTAEDGTIVVEANGNKYEIKGEVVEKVSGTTSGSTGVPEGMYSVAEKVEPAPQELFNVEAIDSTTARITGMNSQYIGKNSAMDYFYDDEYFTAYHAINHPSVTDTLVVPYEVKIGDNMYTVTEVNLYCSETADFDSGIKFPAVTTIIYPNTVTSMVASGDIPWAASVRNIILSDNITEVPGGAFWDCITLESITLPKNLKTIGGSAFWGCGALEEITIPNSVTSIGGSVIPYCRSLKSVYFEQTVAPTFDTNCFVKNSGDTTTFYFKNSTVRDALVEGTHYNATYGTKSTNYSW